MGCKEHISNPLCIDCLESQIIQWLVDFKPTLIPLLKDRTDSFSRFNAKNHVCISCKSNFNHCPHCYSKEITEWLGTEFEKVPNIVFSEMK